MHLGAQLEPKSITKLSPNWSCQMGLIHCPKFLLSGLRGLFCTSAITEQSGIANYASSRLALQTLRAHGLPPPELHLVTRMTTISSLMYTSPSWWGFTDASDRSRLERQLANLRRVSST